MKWSSPGIVPVFGMLLIAACFSCNSNNPSEAENGVYYYPAKNMYYDGRQSMYYYSLDGAASWDSMSIPAQADVAALGPRISIEKPGNTVWAGNALHRKEYNGVLLNIVNNQTISMARADSINKTKTVAVIKKTEPVEIEEPPKKGLKKFFNKLFGKKKKPADNKNQ